MVWELLDSGEDVIVLDQLSTGFKWAVAPEAKVVIGDIADASLVKCCSAITTSTRLCTLQARLSYRNQWPCRSRIMKTTPARHELFLRR